MSLREFAKRKRVNSWQSTENFCGGFRFLGWNFVEFKCGGIFWSAAWVFWGFGGSFAGIFGACGINSAKFVRLLAI